jgi:hypothetical protein
MTKRFIAEPLPQQPGSSAALGELIVLDLFASFLAWIRVCLRPNLCILSVIWHHFWL